MKDAEMRAEQILEEEAKRHREAFSKIERDRNLEIDLLCNRYTLQRNNVNNKKRSQDSTRNVSLT